MVSWFDLVGQDIGRATLLCDADHRQRHVKGIIGNLGQSHAQGFGHGHGPRLMFVFPNLSFALQN